MGLRRYQFLIFNFKFLIQKMKLRQRREISSEMGMSSMTDIIFILLIFFMMVSTLVHPSALNLTLPSNAKAVKKPATTDHLDDVGITMTHTDEIDSYETNRPAWLK